MLYTVGPVEMFEETLELKRKQLPYFRTAEFSELMFEIEKDIKEIMYTNEESKVAILTTSGTGAMESVIASAFNENDKLLIINGGSFGKRFCELATLYKIAYDEVFIEFGEKFSETKLKNIDGSKYTAIVANIHETSTGQLYDIEIIKKFAQEYNLYVIIDAISSFLADKYKMDEFGIDCTIISSQKALSLSPGISVVVVNNKFYENMIKNKNAKTMYLDLNLHFQNMKRGQTPFTPAVGIILELSQRLKEIKKIGVENIIADTRSRADLFRNLVKDKLKSVKILDYKLSNALTPLWIENGNAKEIFNYLKDKYEIYVTPSGGELANNLLRIGHIGNLKERDMYDLVEKMMEIV